MSRVQKYVTKSPPRRAAISQELQEHTTRIKQLMQNDLILLEEENKQLRHKCHKVFELQQKVEMVLKHNQELFLQNQKLAALVQEKMQECAILDQAKKKAQEMAEYERNKLFMEIQKLQRDVEEVQHMKNLTIKEIRTKHQIQIQNMILESQKALKMFQDQLIRLKKECDQKQVDLANSDAKYRKMQSKLKNQINQLIDEIMKLEQDAKKIQAKYKLQSNQLIDQIMLLKQQMKKAQSKKQVQINQLLQQIMKLKDDSKRMEAKKQFQNNQLVNEILKVKQEVKRLEPYTRMYNQIKEQKQKIVQGRKKDDETNALRMRDLIQRHKQDFQKLKGQANSKLQKSDDQIGGLNLKVNNLEKKKSELEQKVDSWRKQCEQREFTEKKLVREVQTYRTKIKQLEIVNNKQYDAIQKSFRQQQTLKQSLQQWKRSSFQLKKQQQKMQEQWEREKQQIQYSKNLVQDNLNNQLKEKQKNITALQKQNEQVKQLVNLRDKSLQTRNKQLQNANELIDRKDQNIDDLRRQLFSQSEKLNLKSSQQKQRIRQNYEHKIKLLNQDYQTKILILQKKLQKLTVAFSQKDSQLNELLKQYSKMKNQVSILSQQQANKKDIDLKFPGATSDLIATKNMFDVFIKTKVLQNCSQVISNRVNKQNRN